jgi:dienelactone hydrolase
VAGGDDGPGVLMMNGGRARLEPGDWSASIEWLANEVRAAIPALAVAELRYRVKSWKRFQMCVDDARSALDALAETGPAVTTLVGFSMGGAVSIAAADRPEITRVVGLAPWIPTELDLSVLAGKRVVAFHGTIDGIPGLPGTRPRASRTGVERARALGADAHHRMIPGGLHGIARRTGEGEARPLFRAARWRELLLSELDSLRRFPVAETPTGG